MLRVEVPEAVAAQPPRTLTTAVVPPDLILFLREDAWALKKYAPEAKAELKLGTWDLGDVLLTMLVVRIGRNDLTTFDCAIDLGSAPGVRDMQCLAVQQHVNLYMVTDQVVRFWRVPNQVRSEASRLVTTIRRRKAWDADAYGHAQAWLNRLQPTASAVWRSIANEPLPTGP